MKQSSVRATSAAESPPIQQEFSARSNFKRTKVGKWWTHVSLRVVMISYFRLMERDTALAAQETSPLLSISSPSSP